MIDELDVLSDGKRGTIDPNILGDLLSISYAFVAIDRQLKDTAYLLAQVGAPGNAKYDKEMEKVMKETDKGDDKRDDGELDKAIHHYEKAWKHAQKAMKEVTIIMIYGANPQTIELGSGYTELGATTTDGSAITIDTTAFVDAVGFMVFTALVGFALGIYIALNVGKEKKPAEEAAEGEAT